jgi:hypothetical protein
MIQRIQTIYLFLACCLVGTMAILPLAQIVDTTNKMYVFTSKGIAEQTNLTQWIVNTLPLMVTIISIALLSLVSIFLYKKRILQKRIGIINMILMLGAMGLEYFYLNYNTISIKMIAYKMPMIFPAVALILTALANRAIQKDENLVKSYDRIR